MLCYPSQSARLCQNCEAAELFYVSVLPMDDRHQLGGLQLGGCLFFFFKLRCGYIYGVFSIQVCMDRVRCICTEHMYGVCMYGSLEAVY